MMPFPLFIYEVVVVDYAFSMNFDFYGIGSKAILVGQVIAFGCLFSKKNGRIILLGKISTIMLMIGIPLIMNYRNVNYWSFEFNTWVPFYLTSISFLYLSLRHEKEINTENIP
jgi:hypothetical protein